jgi:hypothetical protein
MEPMNESSHSRPLKQRPLPWTAIALALFALSLTIPYWNFLGEEFSEALPFHDLTGENETATKEERWRQGFWKRAIEADSMLHLAGVVGNAQRILDPDRTLFDAPQCNPIEKSLALGEPLITLGLLALPLALVASEPIPIYNTVLLFTAWLAAVAMYLLIKDWTGIPAAGIVAGLLYAFHPVKLQSVSYPFLNETTWTLFALLFARRLFRDGGWRNALALAAVISLQLGTSFYPVIASVLIALPFAVWLPRRYGFGSLKPGPVLVAVAGIVVAAAFIYQPYLEMREALDLQSRLGHQTFGSWSELAPGSTRFPGWISILLVLACFALGPRSSADERTCPRWPLLAGVALVLFTAMGLEGTSPAPPLYDILANLLPGFDAIRRPYEILTGLHLAMGVLSGLGCARLMRLLPEGRKLTGELAAIAACWLVLLVTGFPGSVPATPYRPIPARPDQDKIVFFEELADQHNAGPVFEVPMKAKAAGTYLASRRMVMTLFHGRRTSACYSSYVPPVQAEYLDLSRRLFEPGTLERLDDAGFETLVLHHDIDGARELLLALEETAKRGDAPIRRIHSSPGQSAWSIRVPSGPDPRP